MECYANSHFNSDLVQLAESINNVFVSVSMDLDPLQPETYPLNAELLDELIITVDSVEKQMLKTKLYKSIGHDQIPTWTSQGFSRNHNNLWTYTTPNHLWSWQSVNKAVRWLGCCEFPLYQCCGAVNKQVSKLPNSMLHPTAVNPRLTYHKLQSKQKDTLPQRAKMIWPLTK